MTAYDGLAFLYAERDARLESAKAAIVREYEPAIALRKAQFAAHVAERQAEGASNVAIPAI